MITDDKPMDISVTDFKARCLDLIRRVETSGKPVSICPEGGRLQSDALRVLRPGPVPESSWIADVGAHARGCSCDERVSGLQLSEATEVPIGTQQFSHSVMDTKSRDPGIVHARPNGFGALQHAREYLPIAAAFG